jgi:Fatty acid hydroxylase superfamily
MISLFTFFKILGTNMQTLVLPFVPMFFLYLSLSYIMFTGPFWLHWVVFMGCSHISYLVHLLIHKYPNRFLSYHLEVHHAQGAPDWKGVCTESLLDFFVICLAIVPIVILLISSFFTGVPMIMIQCMYMWIFYAIYYTIHHVYDYHKDEQNAHSVHHENPTKNFAHPYMDIFYETYDAKYLDDTYLDLTSLVISALIMWIFYNLTNKK